jgi:hypothetical protein
MRERLVTYNQTTNVAMHVTVIKICYLSISQLTVGNMYECVKLAVETVN